MGILSALHVEQEKRALWRRVETLCAAVGTTAEKLEADLANGGLFLRADWRRNRDALRLVVGHLAGAEA